jgi:hypothetical protein
LYNTKILGRRLGWFAASAPADRNDQEPTMTMRTFVEFWQGMFFLVATLAFSVLFYLVVVKWQPLWTEGFRDFGDISEAIMHLDKTAQPVAAMAPLILAEMDAMRSSMLNMQRSMESIEAINPNVKEMTYTMNRMTWVMDQRMGMINNGMDRVGNKLSPPGMLLPFNW